MRYRVLLYASLVLLLIFLTPQVFACTNSQTQNGVTLTVAAIVVGSDPNTASGWNEAQVSYPSNPDSNCYAYGHFVTQRGHSKPFFATPLTHYTSSFSSGQVGTWDTTETDSDTCSALNLPAVTAFINGACFDPPPGLKRNTSTSQNDFNSFPIILSSLVLLLSSFIIKQKSIKQEVTEKHGSKWKKLQ